MRRLALALIVALAAAVGRCPRARSAPASCSCCRRRTRATRRTSITGLVQLADGRRRAPESGSGGAVIAGIRRRALRLQQRRRRARSSSSPAAPTGPRERRRRRDPQHDASPGAGSSSRTATSSSTRAAAALVGRPARHAHRRRPLDLDHHRSRTARARLGVERRLGRACTSSTWAAGRPRTRTSPARPRPAVQQPRNGGTTCGSAPVPNSGGISADGQGGSGWRAPGGDGHRPDGRQIYYARAATAASTQLRATSHYNQPAHHRHGQRDGLRQQHPTTRLAVHRRRLQGSRPRAPPARSRRAPGKLTNSASVRPGDRPLLHDLRGLACRTSSTRVRPHRSSPSPRKTRQARQEGPQAQAQVLDRLHHHDHAASSPSARSTRRPAGSSSRRPSSSSRPASPRRSRSRSPRSSARRSRRPSARSARSSRSSSSWSRPRA